MSEYDKITIAQFMKAWFDEDYTEISKERFEVCYTEYIDSSGSYDTNEFQLVARINYLSNRLNAINIACALHRDFLSIFGVPFVEELSFFKKFGYTVEWEGDKEKFLQRLEYIEKSQISFKIDMNKRIKELANEREKNSKQPKKSNKELRINFIKMLNSLGKIGYKIDRNYTTVEELSIMIRQNHEEYEASKTNNLNIKRYG